MPLTGGGQGFSRPGRVQRGRRRGAEGWRCGGEPARGRRIPRALDAEGPLMKRLLVAVLALSAAGAAPVDRPAGRSLRFEKRQLFVGPYERATVGDLNRDGRPDIVYGPY